LKNLKFSKVCTVLVVIIVKIIFIRSFLFYCLPYNHSFQTNPNSVTNLSNFFNYIAPASIFYTCLGSSQINYDASITYSSPLIIPSTTETHTYTSLKSGTTYHVRIRAMTSSPLGDSPSTYGASEYSEIAVGSTTLTPTSVGIPPIAPSQVQVIRWDNDLSTNTEISLRISWSDLTSPMLEVSHYHLYWRKKNDNVNGWKFWIEQLSSTKYGKYSKDAVSKCSCNYR